jgi:hypothetical protein
MEWIDVTKELPKNNKRCLGYCYNEYNNSAWKGIVDVYFDSHSGWNRCEVFDNRKIYVLFWCQMPELPKKIVNNLFG